MSFFDGLKTIIHPDVAKTIGDYTVKFDFSVPSDEQKYKVNKSRKIVTLFFANLIFTEKKAVKKAIKASFALGDVILVEESKVDLLERLYKYNNKSDKQILTFFKPILSVPDWLALRDALFLREEFKHHRNISDLKKDIVSRYGERGNTISNVCTAGYFEQVMIPLYNSSSVEFWSYYDIAINRGITALFVNSSMSVEAIAAEIKRRIFSAKAYGLSHIHIHGIGVKNIKNIHSCIDRENKKIGFTVKNNIIDPKLHVCVVDLIF